MKLIECHISGFGAFKDYKLSFDDGLNVILQPNGWGKTTLAAYIKAMLYGFERKRVRDVSANERLRYKPWKGGKYGGTLDFEYDGHEYRVLREFGATNSGDTCKVMDLGTGKPVRFKGEEIGDWVFGLDANAFQKSVFVGQNGFGFDGSTAGLRNRLNALVNEADDVAGLDKAQDALDKRRKFYKKTGNRGHITDVSNKMGKLLERQKEYDFQIAQIGSLQEQMGQLDGNIAQLNDRIAEINKKIDDAQAGEKDTAALTAAHNQLIERQKQATEAYCVYVQQVGKVPAEADLDTVRKAIDAVGRCERAIKDGNEAYADAEGKKAGIAAKYAGFVPAKADVDKRKQQVAELAHQLEVIGLAGPGDDDKFDAIDAAVANDAGLLGRADAAVSGWGAIEAELAEAEAAQREIDAADAKWAERRASIASLKAEAEQAAKSVPDDIDSKISNYQQAAAGLRDAAKARQTASTRVEGLKAQILELEGELGTTGDQPQASEAELGRIDEGVAACKAAADNLSKARETERAEKSKLDALKSSKDEVEDALRAAQSMLAEAEVAKAQAVSADASAKAAQAEAAQSKGGVPVPAVACIAIGVVVAIVGAILGPTSTASFAAYVVAIVLVVIGIVMFTRKSSGDSGVSVEADAAVNAAAKALADAESRREQAARDKDDVREAASEAAKAYEDQLTVVASADQVSGAAAEEDGKAKSELVRLLASLLPGEDLDPETIVVQAPVFKEKLSARDNKLRNLADLRSKIVDLEDNQKKMDESAGQIFSAIGLDYSTDFEGAADQAVEKAHQLESERVKAWDAKERLDKAVAEIVGKQAAEPSDADTAAVFTALEAAEAPGLEDDRRQIAAARKSAEDFKASLTPLLSVFAIERGDGIAIDVERLSSSVSAYRAHKEEVAKSQAVTEESRKAADTLAAELDSWAAKFGFAGRAGLTAEALGAMADDAASAERLDWDAQQAKKAIDEATTNLQKLNAGIAQFLAQYGMGEAANAAEAVEEASKRAKRCDELANEAAVADDQLSDWEEKNGDRLAAAKQGADDAQTAQLKEILSSLQNSREGMVADRAQAEEKRNSMLEELEGYPTCAQEIRLLAQQKQDATAKLFTVQKTSEYLAKARANLDGRYLGGLTNRFNDYANTWLESEELDVEVGGDFNVAVSEGSAAHDVASYSTGYQDLLDICLRMALVDTVFESEEPFIVMDDPFVNLDQDKISRAMLLLALLAKRKQIIYFTCHPSRMEGESDAPRAEFILPEQRASREMPKARARRVAEERAKAQAALVASYHVEPVTQGRAAIRIADDGRTVTNNMFNVRFAVEPESGRRDNAFEVHFIDQQGRALCERQIVEVIDGRVVPERVRFCLTTREDSGGAYDLIIHEQGKEEAALVARIYYKADISFNTEDFGF